MFPSHLNHILDTYGVPADTKAALYDLYVAMGDEVLEVFGDIAEGVASATMLRPEDTLTIRAQVVERYLRRNHPQWLDGTPTPSLWHPRELEGRASGLATPLGELSEQTRALIGENQPVPDGIVMLGRNAHYGGRQDTVSFDVIPLELDDALAVGLAEGQQHTLPGSVGATSGTLDATHRIALLWEVQPNVFKPVGERNRAISKIYRRHRNWHLATLGVAIEWLRAREINVFILRGTALAVTHEVNPQKPVSETIASHHDRTVREAVRELADPTDYDELLLLESTVMNHALRRHVLTAGSRGTIWRAG
jgi:hypothetical protein